MFNLKKWAPAIPTLAVPDVRAAAEWYRSIGFTLLDGGEEKPTGAWDSARLCLGKSELKLTGSDKLSKIESLKRNFNIRIDDIDSLHECLQERVEIIRPPHNTLYGERELVIQDLNGFRITFTQPTLGFRPLAG
jgi:uncharacterized glyoxalase superfamily protein PhnB